MNDYTKHRKQVIDYIPLWACPVVGGIAGAILILIITAAGKAAHVL